MEVKVKYVCVYIYIYIYIRKEFVPFRSVSFPLPGRFVSTRFLYLAVSFRFVCGWLRLGCFPYSLGFSFWLEASVPIRFQCFHPFPSVSIRFHPFPASGFRFVPFPKCWNSAFPFESVSFRVRFVSISFLIFTFSRFVSCISAFLFDPFPGTIETRAFPFDSFLIRFVSCRFRPYTLRCVS